MRDIFTEPGYLSTLPRILSDLGGASGLSGELDRALALADETQGIDASSLIVSWRSGAPAGVSEVYYQHGSSAECTTAFGRREPGVLH